MMTPLEKKTTESIRFILFAQLFCLTFSNRKLEHLRHSLLVSSQSSSMPMIARGIEGLIILIRNVFIWLRGKDEFVWSKSSNAKNNVKNEIIIMYRERNTFTKSYFNESHGLFIWLTMLIILFIRWQLLRLFCSLQVCESQKKIILWKSLFRCVKIVHN